METEANCKLCGAALVLQIDDEYAALGDPFGMTKLATCDSCAELNLERLKLLDNLKRATASYLWMRASVMTPERQGKMRNVMASLLKKYCEVCSQIQRLDIPYRPAYADQLIDRPERLPVILSEIGRGK